MEFDNLVNEIYQRLLEKLAELDDRPALLLLSEKNSKNRDALLQCKKLKDRYRMICAEEKDRPHDLNCYEAVILCDLGCSMMGKAAAGVPDCDDTRVLGKAILQGRRIFAVSEGVELFQYEKTAPAVYYAHMRENLKVLEDSGVRVVSLKELPDCIGDGGSMQSSCQPVQPRSLQPDARTAEYVDRSMADKKLITEKDLARLPQGVLKIQIGERALMTALAKDYAHNHRICVIRAGCGREQVE